MESPFYVELLSSSLNSYELKKFRVQHDETQLTNYLCKIAKKHQKENLNKLYLVRQRTSDSLVAWFALKAATLPYNDKDEVFLTPAIEMTHFAVDERYKAISYDENSMKTGEFIFWNHILETAKEAAQKIACKDLFIFAIDTPKLVTITRPGSASGNWKTSKPRTFLNMQNQTTMTAANSCFPL